MAQDGFRTNAPLPNDRDYRGPGPGPGPIAPRAPIGPGIPNNNSVQVSIAEATAVLESVVRTMYSHIEPGRDNSPNELTAYADLRVLRLYAGALEVSGWSLEQAYQDYLRFRNGGHYRDGYSHISDNKALAAWERYRAYRETVRTMLLRVRQTAVAVEHQVSFCDPQVAQEWRQEVYPALLDTYAAVEPLLIEQYSHQRYTAFDQPNSTTVIPVAANGLPQNAVEVQARQSAHMPYDGRGHGRGKYFEVRSYGGPIRVRGIRYSSYNSATGTTLPKELALDEVVQPSRPLFVQCNRGRWVDASQVEIIWESAERGNRRVYGSIDLVDSSPADQPQPRR